LNDVFVNWVDHVEDFVSLLSKGLKERGVSDGGSTFSCDEENVLLTFFHVGNILLERGLLFSTLGGVISQEVG